MNGLFLLNKPPGISSHDVVNVVRKLTGEKRVGHGGTLDPFAEGLLIVGVGREFTKKLGEITKAKDKTYIATITLGEERDTGDVEGKAVFKYDGLIPSRKAVSNVVSKYLGGYMQEPPVYSAIKVNGRKAYELARKGRSVALPKRRVEVYVARVISYDYPLLQVEFKVSSGTYIRSLARDIGRDIGTGGYLTALVRTRVGEYDLKDALTLEGLMALH